MSASESLETSLDRARKFEKSYDWMGAVEQYRIALSMVSEQDLLKAGEVYERVGYCLFRAACQADIVEEFKKRMQMSFESYDKSAELFEKVEPTRGLHCRGMARYSESWVAEDPPKKKGLLDKCWTMFKEALEGFDTAQDHRGYGKVFQSLSFCLRDRIVLEGEWHERKRIVEEMVKYAENTVARLSQAGYVDDLAWVYTVVSEFLVSYIDLFEERRGEIASTISKYLGEASSLSEKIDDVYFHVLLHYTLGGTSLFVKGDLQAASQHCNEMLRQSEKSRDHSMLGLANYALNIITEYAATIEEDPDKEKEGHRLAIRFAEESIHHSLLVCQYAQASWSCSTYLAESHLRLAELETNLERKRALLKRAVEVGREGSEYSRLSGSQGAMQAAFHVLSKALLFLSQTETSISEKGKLLGEALNLRNEGIGILQHLYPPVSWHSGVAWNYLALIKADLATIEETEEKRRQLLEEAVSSMEECLEECTKFLQRQVPAPRNFAVLGWYHDWFGEILDQLYSLTKDDRVLERAIDVNQGATQLYQKAGMPSRVAEAHWKVATFYNRRGEYNKAAENFELASKNYQLAAEKMPQFKAFYEDHKSYMQAWSEFEKAKLAHQTEEYERAKVNYDNASNLLRSSKRWGYLTPNFSAWATLEEAEDLSKKEKSDESRQAFQLASNQFVEAQASLEQEYKRIESQDESTNVIELCKASENRSEYCQARAELEEANMYSKKEDHGSSAKKYGTVAQRFEKIAQRFGGESDRRELLFQAHLCRALEIMELAKEKADPDLYAEASNLFLKTQKITSKKRNALYALGNACFCKALEYGTKFMVTPNADLYTTAKQYMERAALHYTEAGFESASKWTKATQRFFDAYVYMCNAESEVDPEKKAKHYQLAEKHLDLAARLYEKAGYISKRDETLKHLERVREDKELLITPIEILKTPTIVSAAPTISTPNPIHEEAVGLEGLEHANIQGNLIVRLKEVKVGEDISLEIELVNAGKKPALLIKTEQIIPEGFEIKEKPEIYRVEDSYLNMKGKRLDPLKTEEVKLVLKALTKGTFTLKPRVLYLDETGKYRSHEPEPTTIRVKELGITGWLKGP